MCMQKNIKNKWSKAYILLNDRKIDKIRCTICHGRVKSEDGKLEFQINTPEIEGKVRERVRVSDKKLIIGWEQLKKCDNSKINKKRNISSYKWP